MIELLSLDDIDDRDRWPTEPLAVKELAEGIAEASLRVPVLLNEKKQLIDGWTRIQAVQSLGHRDILAQVTDDFDLALDNLSLAHRDRLPGPRRLYELYRDVKPMGFQKLSHQRRQAMGSQKVTKGAKKGRLGSFRHDFLAVFKVSEHYLQGCLTLYTRFDLMPYGSDRDEYLAAIERVERGEISPLTVLKSLSPPPEKEPAEDMDASRQRDLMERVDVALDGTLRTVQMVTTPAPDITEHERRQWAQSLREQRRKLTQIINTLEKDVEQDG